MAKPAKHRMKPNWAPPNDKNGYHTPKSSFTYSGFKAFDVEVDIARALITGDPEARPKHFRNVFEEVIFVFTIMMATACTTFIQGVVNINTATIGRDLVMTPAQITWIAAAIGGPFMLFFGKTADLFGRKFQIVVGLAFLALCSLITAFAPTPTAFNILCGFLGLGTAVTVPPATGLLFATYPEGKRRNRVTGALGAGNPLGFLLGSLSSGTATKYSTWRASFYVLAAFFLVMTIMAIWTMPAIPRSGNASALLKRFDYLGTTLVAIGTALISASLTQGPALGWKSPKVIVMLLFGLLLLILFTFWQTIYPYPLLNPSMWKNANFTLCILCVGIGYMSFITNQFWIMLYMQDIQSISPILIAVRLLPQVFAGVVWSYLGQYLVSRVSGRVIMGVGGVAYVLGATLVFFMRQGTSYWMLLFPALCITVVGADFQFIVANLYISTQMPTQSSLGAGILQTVMRLSVSLGLSITSAAYGSMAETHAGKQDRNLAYERAYLCTILFAVIALFFVPFMHIGRQGKRSRSPAPNLSLDGVSRSLDFKCEGIGFKMVSLGSESGGMEGEGEGMTRSSLRYMPHLAMGVDLNEIGENGEWNRFSGTTIQSEVSNLSSSTATSWEPRWSAGVEGEADLSIAHEHDQVMVYEVCTKCLEERRILVHPQGGNGFVDVNLGTGSSEEAQSRDKRHTWAGFSKTAVSSPLLVKERTRTKGYGGWI